MPRSAYTKDGELKPRANPLLPGLPELLKADGTRRNPVGSGELQKRLARGLAEGLSAAEAGRRAGYLHDRSAQQAARTPAVRKLVEKAGQELAKSGEMPLERAVAFHKRVADDEDKPVRVRQRSLNAIVRLLDLKGVAARRREAARNRFDRMSDAELDAELERLEGGLEAVGRAGRGGA